MQKKNSILLKHLKIGDNFVVKKAIPLFYLDDKNFMKVGSVYKILLFVKIEDKMHLLIKGYDNIKRMISFKKIKKNIYIK